MLRPKGLLFLLGLLRISRVLNWVPGWRLGRELLHGIPHHPRRRRRLQLLTLLHRNALPLLEGGHRWRWRGRRRWPWPGHP